jgi:hypothetical protein
MRVLEQSGILSHANWQARSAPIAIAGAPQTFPAAADET